MGKFMRNDVTDELRENFYGQFGYKSSFEVGIETLPFDTKGFTVETFAQGRIVQLVSDQWDSPIRYKESGEEYSVNHYFAFINGKFV